MSQEIPYEIDFFPAGDNEKSGDAIALRYKIDGEWFIHVIDGGTKDTGEKLGDHIRNFFGNPSFIDNVIITHADDDHTSGVREIMKQFKVGTLWMNRPWLYAAELIDAFEDDRMTVSSLERRLREAFPILSEIEALAQDKGTKIEEAFQGSGVGEFTILAPSRNRYLDLIPKFSRTPEEAKKQEAGGLLRGVTSFVKATVDWISETWGHETLEEDPETSASNESSVVQLATFTEKPVVLTGDVGIQGLEEAADFAEALGYSLPGVRLMQVPHHGSRHNVSPSVLDRWLGAKIENGDTRSFTAVASVAKKTETHPRKKVVNAFLRRGAKVYATKGNILHHYFKTPERDGYVAATQLEFSEMVEE